jgi:hypothetical protein
VATEHESTHRSSADKSERLQVILAVLLGAAALATAWSAYRGELYSGDSVILLNRSTQTSDRASQQFNAAETIFVQDVGLFTQFAIAAQDPATRDNATYLKETLMRPQLVKMVEWWAETGDEIESPFVKQDPHFVAPSQAPEGRRLRAQAASEFKQARELDDTGDEYVLYTVIFAASLFLYGIASVASSRKVLFSSMSVGAVLFVIGLIGIISTSSGAPKLL